MLCKNHSFDVVDSMTNGDFGLPWTSIEEKLTDQTAAKSKPIVCWLSFSELRYDLFQASYEKFS